MALAAAVTTVFGRRGPGRENRSAQPENHTGQEQNGCRRAFGPRSAGSQRYGRTLQPADRHPKGRVPRTAPRRHGALRGSAARPARAVCVYGAAYPALFTRPGGRLLSCHPVCRAASRPGRAKSCIFKPATRTGNAPPGTRRRPNLHPPVKIKRLVFTPHSFASRCRNAQQPPAVTCCNRSVGGCFFARGPARYGRIWDRYRKLAQKRGNGLGQPKTGRPFFVHGHGTHRAVFLHPMRQRANWGKRHSFLCKCRFWVDKLTQVSYNEQLYKNG